MPRFDRTGPRGQGPLTGRGMGCCEVDGDIPARGQGLGRGQGRGFGHGHGRGPGRGFGRGRGQHGFGRRAMMRPAFNYEPVYSKEEEINLLKQEMAELKKERKLLAKRIEQLEKAD